MNSVSQPHLNLFLFDNQTWQWRKKIGMAKTFLNGSALWIFRCHFCLPEANVRVYIVPIHFKFAPKISQNRGISPTIISRCTSSMAINCVLILLWDQTHRLAVVGGEIRM